MDTVMTRRTEKDPDVAKFINVPDIKNGKPSFISIEPTAPEKEIYDRAVDNFEIWYREQLADLDEMPDWMRGTSMKQLSSAVLVKLNILRRISSCPFLYDSYTGNGTAKMEFIKQIVKKKVDAGEKVLIASVNNPFVDKMIAAIPGAEGFTGKMSIKRRNEMRKRFQNEEYPKVLVVSTQACNLGVNMTSASTAIIVDLLWSPKKLEQMWKRIHGPGQTAECDIIYLINDGMIDEDINELLIGKDRGIDEAIDRIKDDSEVEYFSPIEFAEKMLNKRKGE
jgi:SNF2 family DNA or RNA helicase